MVKHVIREILYRSGMFNAASTKAKRKPLKILEEFLANVWWPPSIGRIPKSLVAGGSGKADQWRTLISILFLGVFAAWQVDGEIPDEDAPKSASKTKLAANDARVKKMLGNRRAEVIAATVGNPTAADFDKARSISPSRNYRQHFDVLIQFTASLRIISTQSITPYDAKRGCDYLNDCCQAWARMGCHLTPYFHYATHLFPQFLRLGPIAYTAAVWAYERHNGALAQINHNGHSGGELEATMMRAWWKRIQITDLISALKSLPRPHRFEDADSIKILEEALEGEKKAARGTLETYTDRVRAKDNNEDIIQLPKQSKEIRLRRLGAAEGVSLYGLVYAYLRDLWKGSFNLVPDVGTSGHGSAFSGRVRSPSHVVVRKRRFGASTRTRGLSACYGYMGNRIPVCIDYLFTVNHMLADGSKFDANIAVVRRFTRDERIPEFPWAIWATDLGVQAWYAQRFADAEVIPMENLTGHFIMCPLRLRNKSLWFTVAHDHEDQEPDVEDAVRPDESEEEDN
ncbi:hypothetical protein FA95DRAFT_1609954 [Auriscalpium vulgare]|uniref:Uncharacterized protein n=1 Tax=Auriscalpium vulgare TaxID=40419 RepID=A0ACB8RFE5_9AGAM|nr:hypothetical protein FA95DRAFT_1609954 [Auriscalpium vulgare]